MIIILLLVSMRVEIKDPNNSSSFVYTLTMVLKRLFCWIFRLLVKFWIFCLKKNNQTIPYNMTKIPLVFVKESNSTIIHHNGPHISATPLQKNTTIPLDVLNFWISKKWFLRIWEILNKFSTKTKNYMIYIKK